MRIALQKEFGCRAPPRTAATGRQTKSKLASEFGEADFAFYYHIKTSPTASVLGHMTSSLALCVQNRLKQYSHKLKQCNFYFPSSSHDAVSMLKKTSKFPPFEFWRSVHGKKQFWRAVQLQVTLHRVSLWYARRLELPSISVLTFLQFLIDAQNKTSKFPPLERLLPTRKQCTLIFIS